MQRARRSGAHPRTVFALDLVPFTQAASHERDDAAEILRHIELPVLIEREPVRELAVAELISLGSITTAPVSSIRDG
jgi:hypothetical protein